MIIDPHADQPVLHRGPSLPNARIAAILVHGRGASAEDILALSEEFATADVAYLAPQAAGNTWYPSSFLAPIAQNEPGITSGLRKISSIIDGLGAQGLTSERIALLGFSQGACLSLEYAARHARRYAAIIGLSGGLIGPARRSFSEGGPPGMPRQYEGSLQGTPVFLGCSDIDPHIPLERVHETAEIFRRLNGVVNERIYPRMGHTVNEDEIEAVRALLT